MTQVIVTDVIVKYGASLVAAITLMSRPEWVPQAPVADEGKGEAESMAAMPARSS
jgi:hypothetical protein